MRSLIFLWYHKILLKPGEDGITAEFLVQNRVKEKADQMLRESHCGFRSGRGFVDQMFCLRALMEKAHEFHTPLYLCFIDLTKAYDSVNREATTSLPNTSGSSRLFTLTAGAKFDHMAASPSPFKLGTG